MKYTMKKTIAFLLTLVMLVNILPVSVLAEQPEEGRRGPLNAPATRSAGTHYYSISVGNDISFANPTYLVFYQEVGNGVLDLQYWYTPISGSGTHTGSFN